MKLRLVAASLFSVLISTQVYALECPPVDAIREGADLLDQVLPVPPYMVFSSKPAVDNWILQLYIKADSQEEALDKARDAVTNVEEAITPEPVKYQGFSVCVYSAPDNIFVDAITFDDGDGDAKTHK